MISQDDITLITRIKQDIDTVAGHIDCHYCRDHMELINSLLQDVMDISMFNLLYQDNPDMLQRYRDIIQSERMLRVLSMGSKVVGIIRKIRSLFRRHRATQGKA